MPETVTDCPASVGDGYVARLIVLLTKVASLTSRNPLPICCPPTMMSCFPTLSISPTVTADMIVGTVEYWYDCWREIVDPLQVQVLIIPQSTSVVPIGMSVNPAVTISVVPLLSTSPAETRISSRLLWLDVIQYVSAS